MNDERIWSFERDLWTGGPDVYREKVSEECLMALPEEPYVFAAKDAIAAVENTPRWERVDFEDQRVSRPEEGLIVISYRAKAVRGDETYHALCTSVLRRLGPEDWEVVQHQQTPFATEIAEPT